MDTLENQQLMFNLKKVNFMKMSVFIKAVLALSTLVTALNDVYKEYNKQKNLECSLSNVTEENDEEIINN